MLIVKYMLFVVRLFILRINMFCITLIHYSYCRLICAYIMLYNSQYFRTGLIKNIGQILKKIVTTLKFLSSIIFTFTI